MSPRMAGAILGAIYSGKWPQQWLRRHSLSCVQIRTKESWGGRRTSIRDVQRVVRSFVAHAHG